MRVAPLGYLLPLLLPIAVLNGWERGGAWTFLPLFFMFVLLPLIDLAVGVDAAPVVRRGAETRLQRAWFDGLLYAWVPIQFALIVWGAQAVAGSSDALAVLGTTLSIGALTGGIGITVAHELGHRLGRLPRFTACALLGSVAYAHFYVEHNKGHHARVATPDDPATARYGESFYAFFPRTVLGSFAGAWAIERVRLARLGRGMLHPANRMLWVMAAPLAWAAALAAWQGLAGLGFFVAQAVVAFTLLELVNYVEHYGLERRRGPDGRYERVRHGHSWNSAHRVSNWYLFNLQRHSHHHANVARRYEELEHVTDAPQLPAGYAAMVLVALVPPLWRRLMHPRLAAWQATGAAPA